MLVITENSAQQIHDYLTTRPMREVEHLVYALRNLRQLEIPPAEVPESPDKEPEKE